MSNGKNTNPRHHDSDAGPSFPFFFSDDLHSSSMYTNSSVGHQDYFGGASSYMSFTEYLGGAGRALDMTSTSVDHQQDHLIAGTAAGSGKDVPGKTNEHSHPVSPNSSISASSLIEAAATEEDVNKGKKESGTRQQQQGSKSDEAQEELKKV